MRKTALFFFLTFGILPLAAGLVYAVLYSLGLVGALAKGFSLEAWRETLSNSSFWFSLGLSALIAFSVVILSTLIALGLLLILRKQLMRPHVQFLLYFPLALPPIVAAFLSFQWLGSSGILARMVYQLGLISSPDDFPPLINDPTYIGVGLTMTLGTFPFLLLVFMQHYRASNLLEISNLAKTIGASSFQIWTRVEIPILLNRVGPTLLLFGVFLFGAYEIPLLLGRQNPAMISIFINQKFRRFNLDDLPQAYVATVVYALVVTFLVLFFLRKKSLA